MRIDVDNLACRRSGRLVFDGLSFTLASGEALIVTGRNGAGKSSLLALIAGRLTATAGTIRADGLGEATLAECVHLVGHRDGLKAALTAEENLAFARDEGHEGAGHPPSPLMGEGWGEGGSANFGKVVRPPSPGSPAVGSTSPRR